MAFIIKSIKGINLCVGGNKSSTHNAMVMLNNNECLLWIIYGNTLVIVK